MTTLAPSNGQATWFGSFRITLKATAETTGGAYGLVEGLVPAGSGPPLHVHTREDEAFWVLEGELTIQRGDETITAGPGSYTFLPRGIPHTFVVEGDAPARVLGINSPGGFEQFFVVAGRPPEHDGLPPTAPPDVALLQRVGAEFGMQVVGPPLQPRG